MINRTLSIVLGTCAFGVASAAMAQAEPPREVSSSATLDDIVVTASRRSESLQEVPTSIGVFSSTDLNQRGIENLRDLAQSTAGLSITPSVGTNTVFIRGVGGGGRNIGFSTRAGIYVDGVYVGQNSSINQSASDVERIEVLRGPQGTAFGRNSVSGAISITTKAPASDLQADLAVEGGNKRLLEIRGSLNVPVIEDKVAVRLSGVHRQRNGFTTNLFDGRDLGNIDRSSFRGQVRFDPTPDFDLTIAADYTRDKSRFIIGEDETGLNGTGITATPDPFVVNFNRSPMLDNEFYGVSGTFNLGFGDGLTLTNITAFRRVKSNRVADNDYSPLDILFTTFQDRTRQFSQELRLTSDRDSRFSYILGLYYLDENAQTDRAANLGSDIRLLIPILSPGSAIPVSGTVSTRSFALFATADYKLTDRLTINVGGRYTSEKIELKDFSVDGRAAPPFRIAYVPTFSDSLKSSRFDPTVSLTYILATDARAYLKYSQGFKSGGFNVDFVNQAQFADGISFRPERVKSYEAGLKSEFLDRRGRLNIAAYIADFEDYQINQFVDLGGGQTAIQLRNAAKVRTWGGELEALFKPAEPFTLGANIGYVVAEFSSFPNGGGPGIDLDGNRLPHAPRVTLSLYGSFEQALTPTLMVNGFLEYNHRGSAFSGAENLVRQALDSRSLVNGRLGIGAPDRRWGFELWVENAFNERYTLTRERDFFGTLIRERGEPRTFGVTGRLAF